MVHIYQAEDQKRFLEILNAEGIPHNVNEYGQIHYPASVRSEVEAAQEILWGPIDGSVKGVTVRTEVAPNLAAALAEAGIDFKVFHPNGKTLFQWSIVDNESAMQVVNTVDLDAGT